MSKFVIECPNCGKFAEAKTGFFARKKIDCACGYTIDVRTDKLAGRECPHCGNMVVFDQSKGEKALCPVCHEPINTIAEQSNTVEFSCAQCGIRLRTNKAAATYTCPVCDCVNDVAERVATEKIKKDGLASIIKYEGDNETLVWKHPIEDFNFGSQLIVHESQEAIFFRDGQALDLFGAGRYTLQTQQLPLLEKIYKLPTDTEGTFHSEVYFVNLATQMGVKWGTDSKVRLFDPASGLHIELGASGEFNIRVTDSRKLLLKVVGTTGGLGQEQLLGIGNGKGFFRSMVMTQDAAQMGAAVGAAVTGGWDCPACGHKNITTNFCPDCGSKKPEPKTGWDCAQCGTKNIQSRFCPNCGAKKPEESSGWSCPECGTKDILSKFCPNCGARKPEEKHGWICPECGAKDIMTNFCPNCGRKKDESC